MKIKFARLHHAAQVPGLGDLTTKFPPDNRVYHKFEMTRLPNGDLMVDVVHKPVSGPEVSEIIIVPQPTVCLMVVANEQ